MHGVVLLCCGILLLTCAAARVLMWREIFEDVEKDVPLADRPSWQIDPFKLPNARAVLREHRLKHPNSRLRA